MFCMECSMLVQHVANLKEAAFTDKTHPMTIKYLGIQGISNLSITFRTLRTSTPLHPLCGNRKLETLQHRSKSMAAQGLAS